MKSSIAETQYRLTLTDLDLVLALVRGRTLAGAATRLAVDPSTVFRALKKLERSLGESLFDRSRQGLLPSELAQELAARAEKVETQLEEAREVAMQSSRAPSGLLRVTTTDTILHTLLLPVLPGFSARYPGIDLELVAANPVANLSQREADIAIRATRKPPDYLVGSRLGSLTGSLYVSRALADTFGPAPVLEELPWVAPDESLAAHPSVRWRRTHYPKVQPRYRCNSLLSVRAAVRQGMGIGALPDFLMQGDDSVVKLIDTVEDLRTELWVLAHPDVRHLLRVKLFFDYLRENIRLG